MKKLLLFFLIFSTLIGCFGEHQKIESVNNYNSKVDVRMNKENVKRISRAINIDVFKNLKFEENLDYWTISNTVSTDSLNAYIGKAACLNTKSKILQIASSGFVVGRTYNLSAWGKVTNTSQRGYVQISFLNSSNRRIAYSKVLQFSKKEYKQLTSPSFIIPENTAKIRLNCWKNKGAGKFYVDEIYFEEELIIPSPEVDSTIFKNNHAYLDNNRYYSSNDSIINNVTLLKDYAIKYQFIDLGQTDKLGYLEDGIQDLLENYINISKQTDPDQKIIAVINSEWRDDILNNLLVQETLKNEIRDLCNNFSIDGIHLDIEPISLDVANDMRYINFVKTLKPVMLEKELSVTGVAWSDVWSNDYISQMANYVDMINIMLYDTGGPASWEPYVIHTDVEYSELWKNTLLRFSDAIKSSDNPNCKLAPTMPVYDKRIDVVSGVAYHDPEIENIKNASLGLKAAIYDGANVYSSGVFWWRSLISESLDKYGHDYSIDRGYWSEWINSSLENN